MSKNMSEDDIRVAAYYIWEQSGKPTGAEIECWLKACEQMLGKGKKAPAKITKSTPAQKKTVKK